MSRTWKIVILIGALGLCAIVAVSAYFMPRVVRLFVSLNEELYDEAYDRLSATLDEKRRTDDRITGATVGFYFPLVQVDEERPAGGGRLAAAYLDVQLNTTVACTLSSNDPCDALADEYAQIILESYARVDELAGLRITVVKRSGIGPFSAIRSTGKMRTIEEWQELLDEPNTANDL